MVINGIDYYVYYQPVMDGNGTFWGMAFAGTPKTKVNAAINTVIVKMVVVAVLIAVLCTVVIIVTAFKIKNSISALAKGMERLAEGDVSRGVKVKDSVKEIMQMVDATNLLQNKLSGVVGTVKDETERLPVL